MLEAAEQLLPNELLSVLRKQKYHIVGRHSAVKKCNWLHQALVNKRFCYKQKFFGISSHRCIQMTPTVGHCTMMCRFCWRVQPEDLGISWNQTQLPSWDDPELIAEECIVEQRRILTGYKVHKSVDPKMYQEAINPKHVAISLAGEPTLYPRLDELVEVFKKKGMTVFIVTNGTNPDVLANLSNEPTQLYVSIYGPDEETYKRLCRPLISDAWKRVNETLELLNSFSCPTVFRITLVKGYNMERPDAYAPLIEKSNPTYVEPKAYMFVGFSRKRLEYHNMPTHEDVRAFAAKVAEETGYKVLDEARASRVVLLSKLEKPIRFDGKS